MSAPPNISDILVALTQEDQEEEPSDAIGYGLSLASAAKAHLTIQSASAQAFVHYAWISESADGCVAEENGRRDVLPAPSPTRPAAMRSSPPCPAIRRPRISAARKSSRPLPPDHISMTSRSRMRTSTPSLPTARRSRRSFFTAGGRTSSGRPAATRSPRAAAWPAGTGAGRPPGRSTTPVRSCAPPKPSSSFRSSGRRNSRGRSPTRVRGPSGTTWHMHRARPTGLMGV